MYEVRGSRLFHSRVKGWLYPYRPRFGNWRFWVVQALVLSIAAAHITFESSGLPYELGRLYFVPIGLLVVPIIYAALNFGFAGSIATATWVIVVTIPNLVFGHSGWERGGEVFQLAILMLIAVFMGQRVDRERAAQRRAEAAGAALRASETRYRRLFESSPIAVLALDNSGTILEANPMASILFGAALEGLKQMRLSDLVGAGAAQKLMETSRTGDSDVSVPLELKNGSRILLEPKLTRVADSHGNNIIQVLFRDVTRELNREAGLKAYAGYVIQAQEEERQRIARELHDDTIQNLALICHQLDEIRESTPSTASLSERLRAVRDNVEHVVKGLRDFTRALRPPILDDLGIVASIRRLVVDFAERTGIEGKFRVIGEDRRLPAEAELGMFRIAQEALWNVEHHAKASAVTVTVALAAREARLDVLDNGAGFTVPATPEDFAASGKLGLIGMWERTELLGGKLEVRSSPGSGTHVTASIPLGSPQSSKS